MGLITMFDFQILPKVLAFRNIGLLQEFRSIYSVSHTVIGLLREKEQCMCVRVCFVSHSGSLTLQTCRLVCLLSLEMAQIWQQRGLHPMQETHPIRRTSWPCTMCVCGCVCVCNATAVPACASYKQTFFLSSQICMYCTVFKNKRVGVNSVLTKTVDSQFH